MVYKDYAGDERGDERGDGGTKKLRFLLEIGGVI